MAVAPTYARAEAWSLGTAHLALEWIRTTTATRPRTYYQERTVGQGLLELERALKVKILPDVGLPEATYYLWCNFDWLEGARAAWAAAQPTFLTHCNDWKHASAACLSPQVA
jgi:hypothetical protein